MLLRRSLFVLDIIVLAAIVVFLALLPAERCMNFVAHDKPSSDSKCHLHPIHHPEFSFYTNLDKMRHLESVKHHFTVCHRLQWIHYTFWDHWLISHEKNRIENDWPLRYHAHILGASPEETTVDVPKTWQYSIAMCLLSALFKIGRILIQHFIGDKKIMLDDDKDEFRRESSGKNSFEEEEDGEVAGTSRLFNDSRYSKIETD
uniref:CX domain-containing protein n=1 Tax=Caenorhabditis tropicalis TaxID=1561998 RepID=A0A1I7UIC6_9PELO